MTAAFRTEPPARTFCAVLHDTGCRISEAVALTSARIDFTGRAVVFESLTCCASKAWLHSLCQHLRNSPVEALELVAPWAQTEPTGGHQATEPSTMPLDAYVTEVVQLSQIGNHPRGWMFAERDSGRRSAVREGRCDTVFATVNQV